MPEFLEKVEFENSECRANSGKACLCSIEGEWFWIPNSQIDDDSEVFDAGHEGTLVISQWWAEKEKLI
jgi:hypothetical protein